jgi:CRISPR-associated endonuclease/helicase Cas3
VGEPFETSLEAAVGTPYPCMSLKATDSTWKLFPAAPRADDRRITWSTCDEGGGIEAAIRMAQAGARVCILRNTVDDAVRTARMLHDRAPETLWTPSSMVSWTAYHSRFIPADRTVMDRRVLADFGKDGVGTAGRILVATQVVEQSLDIDFDWMMTDLAPVDVLLQRIGRVHRHDRGRPPGAEEASILVHAPAEPLPPYKDYQDRFGRGTVYPGWLDLELTRRLIVDSPRIAIPRDNRRLVEAVYHPAAIDEFVGSFPEWDGARTYTEGREAAQRLHGDTVALDFKDTYVEHARRYGADEGVIRTRIGGDRITVALERRVSACFVPDATHDQADVPAWVVLRAGVPDLTSAVAEWIGFEDGAAVYRLGRSGELRYACSGWSWPPDTGGQR